LGEEFEHIGKKPDAITDMGFASEETPQEPQKSPTRATEPLVVVPGFGRKNKDCKAHTILPYL